MTKHEREDLRDLLDGKTVYYVTLKRGRKKGDITATGARLFNRILILLRKNEIKQKLINELDGNTSLS